MTQSPDFFPDATSPIWSPDEDGRSPDDARAIPVGPRTGDTPPEHRTYSPQAASGTESPAQPEEASSLVGGVIPPPPGRGYTHSSAQPAPETDAVTTKDANTDEKAQATAATQPDVKKKWLSSLLGHKETGDDFDTTQQPDRHIKEKGGATTLADLARDNEHLTGGPTTPSSSVVEYGKTAEGAQGIGRGGKPVTPTGKEMGRTPSALNEKARHGAHVIGGAAVGASVQTGGWLSRQATRARDGWVEVSEAYIHSFDVPPPGEGWYERFRLKVGYFAMRHVIAPVQAYGAPAFTAGTGGAWLLSVPSESISSPASGVLFTVSVISGGVAHFFGQRERNTPNLPLNPGPNQQIKPKEM